MNFRAFLILVVLIAAICGAAIWFLLSTPPVPPLPMVKMATPARIEVKPEPPPPAPTLAVATPQPSVTVIKPAAQPLAEWELKIDAVLRANPDNTEAANSATAQMLINMLPTLPADGQAEAAQHISNLLADKDYGRVLPILRNPSMPEEVLDVLVTDLMNRDDTVKLPALLDIAKIPNHPHREEAATDLQIFLDEDYGTDWAKWDAALKAYLKKQAEENAEPPSVTVPRKK
ncbi:MAG: hypothetical protein QOE70_2048 [Chthoniobacter sp.]|jgi:hypothetical protein|nr:hypothetical protein [Chthoniobacter sp.]